MRYQLVAATICGVLLVGCAEREPIPEILVNTSPPGASCELSRAAQPIATAEPTPAIARIGWGSGEIGIVCRRHAFADAAVTLPPLPSRPGFGYGASDAYQRRVDIVMTPLPPGAPR